MRFNNASAPINTGVILSSLMLSGLHWEMHPAQLFSVEIMALNFVDDGPLSETKDNAELLPHVNTKVTLMGLPDTKVTLMGLPVEIKQNFPMSIIRLMHMEKEIGRIECLAVPMAFPVCEDAERKRFEELDVAKV